FATEWLPLTMAAVLLAMAVYALFLRQPGGKLTDWDAYALRTYRDAYVYWPALVAALAGYVMVARREFWREPVFFFVVAGFAAFLHDALGRYERVFFIASGGTDLLSTHISAVPVAFEPLTVPEYETTEWNQFPKGPRTKDLGYSIYRLTEGGGPRPAGFSLD